MDTPNALAMLALGGAIAGDVAATFVVERAARERDRRLWVTGAVVFFASLAMLALALEEIPTAVAQALFIAVGTTAVAVVALFRGENISTRKVISLALLVLGVVVLQVERAMGELVADRSSTETPVLVGWGALWLAIATNVSQVFLLDSSHGFRDPALLPLAAGSFLAELWLFGRAVRCLSPVVAYAVYGTTPAFVTILSVTFFSEALTPAKAAGVAIVTAGIILLATAGRGPAHTGCAENVAAPSVSDTGTGDDPAPAGATDDAFAVR